ncbi:MAPEG family protein [Comamonas sp. GB3 AK4-5]|uniref:MAPEG family protein n=1 Tax=Comamonas sp. GB3 AK4-5 TaxID=3231487 RepID=UPI00351EBE50
MHSSNAILWPVFALAFWTLCMLLLVALRRARSGIHPREYALGDSPKAEQAVTLANRNYMNLLELPVLFYVACLMAYVSGTASGVLLALAWAYVLLRVLHSLVHVSYNKVVHRFVVFVASNLVLTLLWIWLGLHVLASRSAG